MLIWAFIFVVYGDATLVAKPSQQACEELRAQVAREVQGAEVGERCYQLLILDPKQNRGA